MDARATMTWMSSMAMFLLHCSSCRAVPIRGERGHIVTACRLNGTALYSACAPSDVGENLTPKLGKCLHPIAEKPRCNGSFCATY